MELKTSNLFERPEAGERAVLVHVDFPGRPNQESLDEFRDLVLSAGAEVVDIIRTSRAVPNSKYFIGSGKAEEIRSQIAVVHADLILVNHDLSPSQERNLEAFSQCRVLDRTGLILDIFAQHARTFEGKLQVELAQLQHLSTRLVRGWTHLERQKGGIGLRGPGEKQLETDRRLIRERIKTIKKRLDKVRKQRDFSRRARKRANIPTVSLVGYTNAGKSTLFNQLTRSHVYVADQLFATLDPTLRRITLPQIGKVILVDTVGFISQLPHDLVDAFHATLEETGEADLLLHIVDAHHEDRKRYAAEVNEVLAEIDALNVPQLIIYNKIDLLEECESRIDRDDKDRPYRVWVSALSGEGLPLLEQALMELLSGETICCEIELEASEAKKRAELFRLGVVVNESELPAGGWRLQLQITKKDYERFFR